MKQQTEAKQYIEPDGFKGTRGELSIQKESDRYLHIETPDGTAVASCYCEPMDEAVEYDAKLISQSKELAKALQEIIENAAPVPDYPGEFFLHKLSLENAKQVLKEAGLTE